ncbi:MAG: AraC family transcriptional regulator [Paludibacteraceae bacterium]|nr:AraC family transcriptional regulator [Paludibacteraceae bacterium]
MKKNSPYVTLSVPADPRTINSDSVGNYLSSELILIRNFAALDAGHIPFNQPILSKEYRIVSVQNGEVSFSINLRPYHVGKGQILITIPGTILELRQRSSDFDMHMVVFCDLPPSETYDQPVLLETSEQTLSHIEHYFDLIGDVVQNPNWQPKTVRYLLMSLLSDLRSDKQTSPLNSTFGSTTHAEDIFNRFLDLLNQHGATERRVPFYAKRLCLSPNRLSAVIKEYTGQTVMEWINRHTIQQAKVMLRFTDEPIYKIGWDLGFENAAFFAKFFRRETGQTPKEYRDNK